MAIVAPFDFDSHVVFAGFMNDEPVIALADGEVVFPTAGGRVVSVHDGLLSATLSLDGGLLVTGGEDGKVCRIDGDGNLNQIAEKPRKWIDVVAAGPRGTVAFASGRLAWVVQEDGVQKEFANDRAIEGLCFAPKGMRLAMARYNGVSLNWLSGSAAAVDLHWDGAHTNVVFSPDGKYVVTTMAENALHGWRMDNKKSGDGAHMRMSGYPTKPKSLSWSAKGKWLASSGSQAAICWPFSGKDGPMGKAPKELGTRGDSLVTQVACHPSEDIVAIGYGDGMVMAVKIEDASEVLLRRPGKGAISTLCWDDAGLRLVFGSEEGEAGLISLT